MAGRKSSETQGAKRTAHDQGEYAKTSKGAEAPPQDTNEIHPAAPGILKTAPGAGVLGSEASVGRDPNNPPTSTLPDDRASAPRTLRTPSQAGETPTGGAPSPGSSGIRATSDPNFNAQRADEEGVPTPEALNEQKASMTDKPKIPRR
jgi:hypothetical protein